MQLLHLIRRDVVSKFAGEFLSRLVFLVFFFYVGRKIGSTDFGTLNLAISVTYMLGVIFLDPGLNLSTVQLLLGAREHAQQIAGSILSAKLLLFLPTIIVLAVLSVGFGTRLPSFPVLTLGALYALLTVILEYLCSVTNAYHRMDLEAYLKICNRLLIVLFGVVSLKMGGVAALLGAMVMATFAASVIAWFVLGRRLLWVIPHWHFSSIKEALRIGLPIAAAAIIGTIYLKWDLVVLSYFNIGREQIGWYAGAFKIVEAFSALPGILGAGLYPIMIELRQRDPRSLDRLLGLTTKAVLVFSIPAAATVSLFSRQIVLWVYGVNYVPGASVLAVLIWCIVPIFLYFYLVFVNIIAGHAAYNLFAGCMALVVGLIANTLLVPRIGYLGAAWSALSANSAFAMLAAWKVSRLFQNSALPGMFSRVLTAGGCMMAMFLLLPAPVPLQWLLGLAVYFVALVVLGSLGSADLSLMIRLLQFRAQPQE